MVHQRFPFDVLNLSETVKRLPIAWKSVLPRAGSVIIGYTLLCSGCLKLYASLFSGETSDGFLSREWLNAIALLEIGLAIEWIICTLPQLIVWRATLVLSCVFAGFALVGPVFLGLECDCFGGIRHEETVRVIAILLLFLGLGLCSGHCQANVVQMSWSRWRWILLIGISLGLWFPWQAMSSSPFLELLKIPVQRLELRTELPMNREGKGNWTIQLGSVRAGSETTCDLDFRNTGITPVGLIGYWRACSCTSIQGLPESLPPAETKTLELVFKSPQSPGAYEFPVELFSDQPGYSKVHLKVLCNVTR